MKKGEKKIVPSEKKGDKTEVLAGQNQRPLIVKKARFTVMNGKDAGKELVIQKAFVMIGTLPGSDLVLTDPTVSRHHAEVEERSDGYMLRDHDSTNGTFLDGVKVREAYLSSGSVIRLGNTEMTFLPLEERIEILRSDSDSFGELTGSSAPMREVYGMLERIAPTDVTVLLEGETGTGKELAARAIHKYSRRAGGSFVVCDAPPAVRGAVFMR